MSSNKMLPNSYLIPLITMPRTRVNKDGGDSKKKDWMQIEGVPCKIINYDTESKTYCLNSFASADPKSNFRISDKTAIDKFKIIKPTADGFLLLEKYPEPIHVSEFDKRSTVTLFKKSINILKNKPDLSTALKNIFNDKIDQLFAAQGSPRAITLTKYNLYKLNGVMDGLQRIGDPIFNRQSRGCPPIDISYTEFMESPSFPAPIGIRPKDYCLPSNLLDTVQEMINQIMNFKNISAKDFTLVQEVFSFVKPRDVHCCKYCGKAVDIEKYWSEYKSQENYIEICHRDPDGSFTTDNMYWGHGECNRRQGGYSEMDIKKDGLRLMFIHGDITQTTYNKLLEKLD